jgi:hypothetical protein
MPFLRATFFNDRVFDFFERGSAGTQVTAYHLNDAMLVTYVSAFFRLLKQADTKSFDNLLPKNSFFSNIIYIYII